MPEVITVASAKGGSGKTLITASLGKLLAQLGHEVLLIDTDAATNGLTLLYLEEVVAAAKLGPRSTGVLEAGDFARPFQLDERVSLLPATYSLQQTDGYPIESFEDRLKATLAQDASQAYDFVLIDAQAGSDPYAGSAMAVAESIVIVAEYDPVSVAGVDRLRRLFPDELAHDRHWILFNKLLPDFAKSFSEFLSIARYLPPLPWDAEVVKAYATGRVALDLEEGNAYTLALMRTAGELFGAVVAREIDDWRGMQVERVRRPLREQLDALNAEIDELETDWVEREYRLRSQRTPSRISAAVMGLLGFAAAAGLFFATGATTSTTWAVLGPLVAATTGVSITVVVEFVFRRGRSLREQIMLEAQSERFRQRLVEAEQQRVRLQELIDSDLERLQSFR